MSVNTTLEPSEEGKENTNLKSTSAGQIYQRGIDTYKESINRYLQPIEVEQINNNHIYIHDSEYYELTLNCCSVALPNIFSEPLWINGIALDKPKDLVEFFTQLSIFIINVENEIAGGIAIVNFDKDLVKTLKNLSIPFPTASELQTQLASLFQLMNLSNCRFGNQSPYLSLSIGIVDNKQEAIACDAVLHTLHRGFSHGKPYIFPNVQFRVKSGVNFKPEDPFFKQYQLSLKTTSHQMNPTYILADSNVNENIEPLDLHVVGCRSRLLDTTTGKVHGIGRANLGAVSINLPLLSMNSDSIQACKESLKKSIDIAANILIKKIKLIKPKLFNNAPTLMNNNVIYPFNNDIDDIFREISLSIGFIGAHEMAEVLLPKAAMKERIDIIDDILKFMNCCCSALSTKHNRIFTLIGVSGESLSYRFADKDSQLKTINSSVLKKGFYTNSFHVPVEAKVTGTEKLDLEGQMHAMCSGGSISYLEISHVKQNTEGLEDLIKFAVLKNVHYLGFNFAKNICNQCYEETEENDKCTNCGSLNLTLIRRVSGYLGYLNSFSKGKVLEESLRVKHTAIRKEMELN